MRTAVIAGCLVLAGCAGPPRQVVRDLVAELPVAEVLLETPVIDAGKASARRWLAGGWYPDESSDGGLDFAWSEGDGSAVEVVVLEPRTIDAQLRCRPFAPEPSLPRVVQVELNGRELTSLELVAGFATYPLRLPADRLRPGRNSLGLRHPWARSPRELGVGDDWRRLALALDWLRLQPGQPSAGPWASEDRRSLHLPVGSSVGYHLRFSQGLRFELDELSAVGAGDVKLLCAVTRDGGQPVPIADVRAGAGAVEIGLEGPREELFRLDLQAVSAEPRHDGTAALEIVGPRVTAPPSPVAGVHGGSATRPVTANPKPNIVIYLVDALRADRLGVYGQPRPLSPHLDAFAATATVYQHAWAQSSWTRPAVASLLTGLRPEVHGVNGRLDRLGGGPATLAGEFAEAGYETAGVVANPNASAAFGLDRGFRNFVLMPPDRRRSSEVHSEVVRWLDSRDPARPFLLYIHTVDPHLPYDPPEPFRQRFAPSVGRSDLGSTEVVGTLLARSLVDEARWSSDLLQLYDAEVASNDEAFGALLAELDRRGLADSTAVVFLSDHGEEFFDHGGWIHGRTLYREVLQVPLLIRLPGQLEGRREASVVSHVDLMPTLLELAGIDAPAGIHGRSLVGSPDVERPAAAYLELDGRGGWSAVTRDRHAVRHRSLGYAGPVELYELRDDPGEQRDLGPILSVTAGALVEESRRQTLEEVGRYDSSPAVIDDDLRRRLEALGYL